MYLIYRTRTISATRIIFNLHITAIAAQLNKGKCSVALEAIEKHDTDLASIISYTAAAKSVCCSLITEYSMLQRIIIVSMTRINDCEQKSDNKSKRAIQRKIPGSERELN